MGVGKRVEAFVFDIISESTDASFKSSSNSPQFDFRLTDSCHHVFGEGSDESINYVEMGCEQGKGVGKWGENELVVGVQISSEGKKTGLGDCSVLLNYYDFKVDVFFILLKLLQKCIHTYDCIYECT